MGYKSSDVKHESLFSFYLLLIVLLPLPLGSNRPWSWHLMAMLVMMLMIAWSVKFLFNPYKMPAAFSEAKPALYLFCLWLFLLFFQTVPLPLSLLEVISPASLELYQFSSISGELDMRPISIDRGETLSNLTRSFAYVAFFFLTLVLVDSRERLKIVAKTFLYIGVAGCVYGLLNTLSGVEYIWWWPKTAYVGFVTGTFISRNHFAGHLEMIIPFSLSLLFFSRSAFAITSQSNMKAMMRALLHFILKGNARLGILVLILFSSLFLTASRGGIASLFVSISIVIMIIVAFRGKEIIEARIAPVIIGMAVIAAIWLGLGALPERMSAVEQQSAGRISAWNITQDIISDYSLLGSGAGTFKYIFSIYEDGSLKDFYNHAHNDYLEIIAEQGYIGFSIAALAFLFLIAKIMRSYVKNKDILLRGMLFASLVGSISLLLHALVDFNFHIPANAAYFMIVLGLGIVAANLREKRISSKASEMKRNRDA